MIWRTIALVYAGALVLTGLPDMASAQLLSPGALSRAHAEIDGDDNCNECHASGRRVEESRCFRCHDDLRRRMGRGLGLHGREYRGRNCVSCHVEHLGRGTALVRWPGGAPERLDHGDTGWPLRGAHLSTGCRDCHDNRNRRGNRTYLGQSGACASCHDDDDPHDGRFGQQCNTCHGEQSWRNVRMSEFDHSLARFALRGEHQSVACRACHGEPPRYRGVAFDTCASCHDDPHGGRYGPRCASCHNETGWDDLGDVRNNHPGLSLRNGHARVACGRCHDRGVDVAPSQGRACASCHRPVHEAEFGRNCAQCHRSIKWVGIPERIGRAAHARTAFPLEGRHERVDCQGCHRRELSLEARYRELTFDQCDGCHQDRHSGELADLEGGGECESCHTVRGFAPSLFGVSAHASTGFALDGRHAAVPCSGCHQHDGRPRLSWSGAQEECASCHDNPHGDQFADEMTRGGCASCHSPAGWDRPNIDHSIWPLTGAHELATCNACHTPSAEDRGLGRGASYRGVARECGGCHDDVHAGQFRLTDPQKTCETCHSTVAFRIRRFDHVANADYALEGRHAEAECASCHPTISLRNDAEVVRYRLGYRECNDCHASPHEDPER